MSSTIRAVCGSSSLSQAPLWPCWANLKIDGATGKRLLARGHRGDPLAHPDRVGQLDPAAALRAPACSRTGRSATGRPTGTGRSPASPSGEVRQARQAAGRAPAPAPRRRPSRPSSEPRATAPRPRPERARKCRRLTAARSSGVHGSSLLRDRLVEVQDDAGRGRVGASSTGRARSTGSRRVGSAAGLGIGAMAGSVEPRRGRSSAGVVRRPAESSDRLVACSASRGRPVASGSAQLGLAGRSARSPGGSRGDPLAGVSRLGSIAGQVPAAST